MSLLSSLCGLVDAADDEVDGELAPEVAGDVAVPRLGLQDGVVAAPHELLPRGLEDFFFFNVEKSQKNFFFFFACGLFSPRAFNNNKK